MGLVVGLLLLSCCSRKPSCDSLRAERDEAERRLMTVLIQYEALSEEVERLRALVEELQGRSPFGYAPDTGDTFVPLSGEGMRAETPAGHCLTAIDHTASDASFSGIPAWGRLLAWTTKERSKRAVYRCPQSGCW
jgi:hypothetical protein